MKNLEIVEMKKIIGGGSLTSAMISALKGFTSVFFEIGQAVGGAIRRISANKLCSF